MRTLCMWCKSRPAKRLAMKRAEPDPTPYFCSVRCAARLGIEAARAGAMGEAERVQYRRLTSRE
jgi:hypothetical protein